MTDEMALTGINRALARYVDGVNQRDPELWSASWDEDAQWLLFDPEPIIGRDAIVASWIETMKDFPFVVMHTTQGDVRVEGDTAEGRSYTFEVVETADGRSMRVWGRYEDSYRCREGVWRFSRRAFSILKAEEYQ
ncbi:MAG: nuclear transport factor 2 family protein [Sphingobium sp.]